MQAEATNEALKLIARALAELEDCNPKCHDDELKLDVHHSIRNAIQLLKDTIEKLAI
jgi:hypothetical protein